MADAEPFQSASRAEGSAAPVRLARRTFAHTGRQPGQLRQLTRAVPARFEPPARVPAALIQAQPPAKAPAPLKAPAEDQDKDRQTPVEPAAKALARIKDVNLTVVRPKVTWKRVGDAIQYGSVPGADNYFGLGATARVLPGPGQLRFGFVQACLPLAVDHVEWQDRSKKDVYRQDRTQAIRGMQPSLDANATVDPWYIDPPIAPDKAGKVDVVMSDNPTGGTIIDFAPRQPTVTLSQACWSNTFVTAFVVQLPDGTRRPLKSLWWQLHFSASVSPKDSDPLSDVKAETAVSVSPVVEGAIDPALNLPPGGPYCTDAIHAPGKIEGPGDFHTPCAELFKR